MMKFFKSIFLLFTSVTVIQAQITVVPTVVHLTSTSTPSAGAITLTVSGGVSPYSYTWSPGGINTKDISNKTAQTYTVKVKDNSDSTVNYTYNIGYKCDWDQLDKAELKNDTLIVKNTVYYGQAVTKNTLAANTDGWFEYVLRGMDQIKYIGFLDSLSPNIYDPLDMDYAFYYDGSSNYLYVCGSGSFGLISDQIAEGSVLRIERVGSTINFKVNGAIVYSVVSATDAAKAWKIKTLINAYNSGSMINVGCSFYQQGNVTFKNYLRLSPTIVHTSSLSATDGSINVKASQAGSTYTYTWQPGSVTSATLSTKATGSYSLTAADPVSNKTPFTYNIGYKCNWDYMIGCVSRNDSLIGSGNIGAAYSKNTLSGGTNGWFEFVLKDLSLDVAIGFLDSLSSVPYDIGDIDYGFSYLPTNKITYLRHKGSLTSGVYANENDVLRIERIGNDIYYKINGIVVGTYTDAVDVTKAWKVKGITYGFSTLVNIGCSFYQQGNSIFPNYIQLNPTVVHSSFSGANDGYISVAPVQSGTYTYTWQPGAVTSASLTNKPAGTYSVTVEDAIHTKNTLSYHIGYKVSWDSLMGCIGKEDTLLGNGVYTWGRGMSKNNLSGGTDGWLEYVVKDPLEVKFVGVLDSLSPVSDAFGDIDFGFYCQGNGYMYTVNHGSLSYAGLYHEGSVLRIERIGDTINYLVDGAIISVDVDAIETQKDWRIKGVLGAYTTNPTLRNVGCSFPFPGFLSAPYVQQDVNCISGKNGSFTVTPIGGVPPYTYAINSGTFTSTKTYTNLAVGTYTVKVRDNVLNEVSQQIEIFNCPKWTTPLLGASVSSTGDVVKTGSGSTWDDSNIFTAEPFVFSDTASWISFDTPDTSSAFLIGFRSVLTDSLMQTTNYKLFIQNASVTVLETDNDGFYNKFEIARVTPQTGFKIQLTAKGIEYYRRSNSNQPYQLIYISKLFSSSRLIVETMLYTPGSKINKVRVSAYGNRP